MKVRLLVLLAFTVGLVALGSMLPGAGPATLAAPAGISDHAWLPERTQSAPQRSDVTQGVSPAEWTAIYLPIAVAPPPIFYADDFESGVGQWTPFVNYWGLSPEQWFWDRFQGHEASSAYTHNYRRGRCCSGDALTMYLGPGSADWTDYRYSVRFRVQSGRQTGLWFRGAYKDSDNRGQWVTGYYFTVVARPDGSHPARLWQLRTEEETGGETYPEYLYHYGNPMMLGEVELTTSVNFGEWHTLTVEAQGPHFKCYVDDELAFDYTDTEGSIFLKGTVGMYAFGSEPWEAIINFDDVLVETLGAK